MWPFKSLKHCPKLWAIRVVRREEVTHLGLGAYAIQSYEPGYWWHDMVGRYNTEVEAYEVAKKCATTRDQMATEAIPVTWIL